MKWGSQMPHRLTDKCNRAITRRTFAAHALGVAEGKTSQSLKSYLHAAKLTASPDEKLDLVMVDDYEHFTDLLAEHGVPLARNDAEAEPWFGGVVTLPRRRYVIMLGALGSLVARGGIELLQLTPWM